MEKNPGREMNCKVCECRNVSESDAYIFFRTKHGQARIVEAKLVIPIGSLHA